MRRRSLLLSALLVFGCHGATPVQKAETKVPPFVAEGPLSLASGTWSPFTDVPGKPRLAIDLVQEALKRAHIEVKNTIVHPQELMGDLEAGKFAGSEALWFTEERNEYLLYSEPYLENRLVLLARAGTDVTAASLGDLSGKSLGIVEGYAYGPGVLGAKEPRFVLGPSDEENLRKLLKGEVDYILVDELLVYYLFEYSKEKAKEKLSHGTNTMATAGLHFAIRKDYPGAQGIISAFNRQIEKMTRDGTYHEVLKVSWLVSDVDGDGTEEAVFTGHYAGQDPPEVEYRLSGATAGGTPRFMVEGEVYGDWEQVPARYKMTTDEPIDRFKPGINSVLFEF